MKSLLLLGMLCAAGAVSVAPAQSIAGEWDASINTPGGPRPLKITFQLKGDSLTGTVKRPAGEVPLVGTISGDVVRFSYSVDYNGNVLMLTITAKVTGDSMAGTVDFAGAGEDEFWAKRVPSPPRNP